MAIRNFSVGPMKGLRNASYEGLPNLAVIAGPNGVGKSTLLHQLWQRGSEFAEPGTRVSYTGPHRSWRKSTLPAAAMFLGPRSYRQSLELQQVPNFDLFVPPGLQFAQGQLRLPDSTDEAQSFVKFAIGKMEYRRLNVLQEIYEREGQSIPPGALPDTFAPLRLLTRFLLPHLEFARVDISNDRDVRCLFRRVDGDAIDLVEIDELSSGEKAVIALFLPFLESQIGRLLGDVDAEGEPLATTLIDEPELHLHPVLQISLVEYIRTLTDGGEAQFIVATHSPTILDALKEDELFLLAPLTIVGDGNQFVKVSESEERLEAIRDLTGSTHLVTRCRPVVYVEGDRPDKTKQVADQRLAELLIPEAASWVMVPASGRREAITSAHRLREAAQEGLPGIPVFALVDQDQGLETDPDFAITWPVAMVENLLLDPEGIWDLLVPHRERVPFSAAADVDAELRRIAQDLRADEIRLRAGGGLGPVCVRVDIQDSATVTEALGEAKVEFERRLGALGTEEELTQRVRRATEAVDVILNEGRELEAFRGKEILKRFHDLHNINRLFPYQAFVYEIANRLKGTARLQQLTDRAALRIRRYVPPTLVPALEAAAERLAEIDAGTAAVADEALSNARLARAAWEAAEEDDVDRGHLREELVQVARTLRAGGVTDVHDALLKSAVQVGLG
jgi:hypothetical protein